MPTWLTAVITVAVIAAIFASTEAGRRLRGRLPIDALRPGAAPKKDRDYLLRVCGGDRDRVRRLLDLARERNPDMTEAEAYRRAIRAHLRDKT